MSDALSEVVIVPLGTVSEKINVETDVSSETQTQSNISVYSAATLTQKITLIMETEIMTTLVEHIEQLATAVGADMKTTLAAISGLEVSQGDLANLSTAHKSTLVGAIVELKNDINAIDLANILDDSLVGTTTTWSSFKIDQAISASISAVVNGADGALDTLKEISDALLNNPDVITVIQDGLGKRVRFDAAQTLTPAEKVTALSNIGAAAVADLTELVSDFNIFKLAVGDIANANPVGAYSTAKTA